MEIHSKKYCEAGNLGTSKNGAGYAADQRRRVSLLPAKFVRVSKVGLHLILVFIWPCDYDHHENPLRNAGYRTNANNGRTGIEVRQT